MKIGAALKGGWRALDTSFSLLVASSALVMAPELATGAVRVIGPGALRSWTPRMVIVALGVAALLRLVVSLLLRPGYLALHAACVRGERVGISQIFARMDRSGQLLVAQALRGAVALACAAVAAAPALGLAALARSRGMPVTALVPGVVLGAAGFAWGSAALVHVEWLVCVQRLGAWSALAESWRWSRGHRLRLMVLCAVATAIELAGVVVGAFLFGVGLLFTVPATRAFTTAAMTHAYLQLRASRGPRPTGTLLGYVPACP